MSGRSVTSADDQARHWVTMSTAPRDDHEEEVISRVASPVEVLAGVDGSACADLVDQRDVIGVERREGVLVSAHRGTRGRARRGDRARLAADL
jgi:hypothetical protein